MWIALNGEAVYARILQWHLFGYTIAVIIDSILDMIFSSRNPQQVAIYLSSSSPLVVSLRQMSAGDKSKLVLMARDVWR